MNSTFLLILITIVFSALFSGVEIAFVSSNKLRLELDRQQHTFTSRILSIFFKRPDHFISTMLVGNNIALVVYGISMANILEPYIAYITSNSALIVLIQTIISTLIILTTAEFIPKTLFRIDANVSLKIFAIPILLCYIILYPISLLTAFVSRSFLRLFGVKVKANSEDRTINKVDLDYFIQSSIDQSGDSNDMETEVKIFQNVLDFSTVKIRDCMVPRIELVAVEAGESLGELMSRFVETGKSKVLVYKDNIDNILGYIHSSEMFMRPANWRERIKPVPMVPETMAANKLMKILMQEKRSMAVVLDEFGGVTGVVTLEDLVEEILGDIEDEHDTMNFVAKRLNDNEYILSGRIEIEELNEQFSLHLKESDDYATVAGYILHHYQKFPKINETVDIEGHEFKVIKATNTKIELVRLKVNN